MLDLRVTKLINEWDDLVAYRIRTEQKQLQYRRLTDAARRIRPI